MRKGQHTSHVVPEDRQRIDLRGSLLSPFVSSFTTRDGSFSSRVAVCRFSYTSVAGHRIGKPDNSILNAEGTEVWIAPVEGGFAIPARIQLQTRVGRIVLEPRSISFE